ncbi:MAG: TolC family protein [Spirochaetales bacterium]|nr:TolC family protein [Spirochaetales bacterium]
MLSVFLFLSIIPCMGVENSLEKDELILEMIRIVIENSTTLMSQERLIQKSLNLPEFGSGFSATGANLNMGAAVWNPNTDTFGFIPSISLGMNFSFRNPARIMNILLLKKEQEGAKQDYEKFRESIISDLLSSIREILMLNNQKESLKILMDYLEEQADLMEKQVNAGVMKADKLWDLKERIIDTRIEIEDVKTLLYSIRLESAFKLGGDAWKELFELSGQLK